MPKKNGNAAAHTMTMTLRKQTKGTFVYDADDDGAAVRTVYVAKHALGDNPPKSIQLTVSPAESA